MSANIINKIKPQRLHKGDVIGIVSPARWMDEEELYKTSAIFEQTGFRVKISPQNLLRMNQFAGSDKERCMAIEEMFEDRDVKAIVCARGGYGALRIIDTINYNLIASNPKIFIGYSDITALLISIYKETGLVTFHGPMLYSFINEVDPFTVTYLQHAICNPEPYIVEFPNETLKTEVLTKEIGDSPPLFKGGLGGVLRPGIAEGELIGGNLSILVNLIGTKHDFDTAGKILIIEDVDEYLYNIDRMLIHLKRSGKLDKPAGLIIGEMKDIKDNNIPFGKDVDGIVLDIVGDTSFPIISNFPCGHGKSLMTMPISISARFVCDEQGVKLSFLESLTED
ncbi:MAG: LD-carboxypeptidase [Nitrospirae bacterium]|nr:LD-carboxypeptidase [Nitrospirota bacterium]